MGMLQEACGCSPIDQRPTITARLKGEKEQLEGRLTKINEALELMEKNPEIAQVLDALGRTYL